MNRIIKILIFSDLLILSAFGLLNPIFAVFVLDFIRGGTVVVVGIAEAIYLGVKALTQIIAADYLDAEANDKKNLIWTLAGSILLSLIAFLLLFIHTPLHLYLIQVMWGIASGITVPGWYALFTQYLDRRRKAFQWSFHSTLVEIGAAGTAATGGLVAGHFGFPVLIMTVGGFSLLGSFLLILLFKSLLIIEKKEMIESKKETLTVRMTGSLPIDKIKPQMLEIKKFGDPILKKKSEIVKEISFNIQRLVKNMLMTMSRGGGIGLAAPQVGRKERIIVLDVGNGPLALINPRIIRKSNQRESAEEGCLSLPGIILKIKRFKKIEVEGYRPDDGHKVKIEADGLLARVLQHEIDHLNGVLIVDKATFWQRWRIRRLLDDLKSATQQKIKDKQREKIAREKEKAALKKTAERKLPATIESRERALIKIESPIEKEKQD